MCVPFGACVSWARHYPIHMMSTTANAPIAEQIAAAEGAVLAMSDPDRAALVVRGADRATWLNGLLTCDVTKARPGVATYGLAVTQKGRVLADVVVLVAADTVILSVPAAARAALLDHFGRYLIMEDAEMSASDEAFFSAHGPAALALADTASLREKAVVYTLDVTGRGGVLFVVARPDVEAFAYELTAAAIALGGVVGEASGWTAVRLERAVPAFGADFDVTTYPQEASLERRAVSFDKGCYLGQEVVCMLEMRGHVKRKLVPIEIEGAAAAGAPVTDAAGAELGRITSAYVRADGAHARALAMVKLSHAGEGAELRVGPSTARVVASA